MGCVAIVHRQKKSLFFLEYSCMIFIRKHLFLSPYLRTFMELRNRFRSLCSLSDQYEKYGCRTGPSGWESIPGLLKRFTNTGSVENVEKGEGLPLKANHSSLPMCRHHAGHYICEADNGFGPEPITAEVKLEVHRKCLISFFVKRQFRDILRLKISF